MSSQNASSSNQEDEQPPPPTAIMPTTFPRFLELPNELQILIWEWAFWVPRQRRFAVLRVSSPPSPRLSHQVLSLKNPQVKVGWPIFNPSSLASTDHVARLLATTSRSRAVIRQLVQRTLEKPWLERLGLTQHHIDPEVDVVCFGGDQVIMSANRFMMAITLVLGNEFPNIMCPALSFCRLIRHDLQRGFVDPVSTALATLRGVDPVWNEIFCPGPNTLPSPGLPRTMYFLLKGPPPRRPLGHSRERFRFEQLELHDPSSSEAWDLAFNGSLNSQASSQFRKNLALSVSEESCTLTGDQDVLEQRGKPSRLYRYHSQHCLLFDPDLIVSGERLDCLDGLICTRFSYFQSLARQHHSGCRAFAGFSIEALDRRSFERRYFCNHSLCRA
jgi:hypothetical protein